MSVRFLLPLDKGYGDVGTTVNIFPTFAMAFSRVEKIWHGALIFEPSLRIRQSELTPHREQRNLRMELIFSRDRLQISPIEKDTP
ncbi:MAG: hypothetical protein V2I43_07660 [Parvularcula sp.]|nr:hypothetical protein [Parvularcula sp.]